MLPNAKMNLTRRIFKSDHPVALDNRTVRVYSTEFLRDSGEGSDVVDQYLRCDGCKTLFDNVEDVIEHAKFHGERGCQCVPHATCGHRVRWTGVIEDGELILGTGCWVHVHDDKGNLQTPRER